MPIPEKQWQPLGSKPIKKFKRYYRRGNKQLKVDWSERKSEGFTFLLDVKDSTTDTRIDKFFWNSKKSFERIKPILKVKYGLF